MSTLRVFVKPGGRTAETFDSAAVASVVRGRENAVALARIIATLQESVEHNVKMPAGERILWDFNTAEQGTLVQNALTASIMRYRVAPTPDAGLGALAELDGIIRGGYPHPVVFAACGGKAFISINDMGVSLDMAITDIVGYLTD